MWTSSWLRLLLLCSVQCIQTSGRFVAAMHNDTSERDEPKITVNILIGEAVELQCSNKTTEGSAKWWQTPFGSFEDGKFISKYPVEIDNGILRILRSTASHNGLYYCHRVDSSGMTTVTYDLNVVMASGIQRKAETYNLSPRMIRAVKGNFSQSHVTAAVTSSVLVTFIAAFALGAFSRPYVMKCLAKTRPTIRHKTGSHKHINGEDIFAVAPNEQSLQFESVSFYKNRSFEDETIVFASKSPPRVRTQRSLQSKQKNQVSQDLEDCTSSPSESEGVSSDILTRRAEDESDQLERQGGEEQTAEAASESITHRQPKRKSRVIKLYNYDEEGQRYSHINEPELKEETEPRGRLRVMSLTRLSAIMSQAESLDFIGASTNSCANQTRRTSEEGLVL